MAVGFTMFHILKVSGYDVGLFGPLRGSWRLVLVVFVPVAHRLILITSLDDHYDLFFNHRGFLSFVLQMSIAHLAVDFAMEDGCCYRGRLRA